MTNGEILEKLFPGFEEIQVFSEYILRNGKETIIKVDREFWESEMREATPEERKGIDKYINSIAEPCGDCISRQAVLDMMQMRISGKELYKAVYELPSVTPQEPSIAWVTSADGAKIAFWDVPAWKVTKICEILGEPQESEVQE